MSLINGMYLVDQKGVRYISDKPSKVRIPEPMFEPVYLSVLVPEIPDELVKVLEPYNIILVLGSGSNTTSLIGQFNISMIMFGPGFDFVNNQLENITRCDYLTVCISEPLDFWVEAEPEFWNKVTTLLVDKYEIVETIHQLVNLEKLILSEIILLTNTCVLPQIKKLRLDGFPVFLNIAEMFPGLESIQINRVNNNNCSNRFPKSIRKIELNGVESLSKLPEDYPNSIIRINGKYIQLSYELSLVEILVRDF